MIISKKLPGAIKLALFTGVTMTASTAIAQDAAPAAQEATTLDRVEVTGSRIRQVDKETAAPVLTIDRAAIEKQGFNSVADILQNVAAVGSPAISRTNPLSSGESVGGQYIDLRNLGAERTLVLVNGKRLGQTNDGLQDIASIPAAMVERVEILKDGASTTYGSDAISGVINIITRSDFEGFEANAYLGQYGEGDGDRQQYSFVMGFTGDRGSLTAGVEYTKEDPVWAKDRWFSRTTFPSYPKGDRLLFDGSGTIKDGAIGVPGFDSNKKPVINNMTLDRTTGNYDTTDINNFRPTDSGGLDATFPGLASTLQTGIERKSAFLSGRYDITENTRFTTEVLYTDRDSFAQNAGYPFRSAGSNWNTPLSADSVFNPLNTDAGFLRRGWEVPREVRNNLQTFRFSGALEGSFQIGDHYWDWDVGALYNQNKGLQVSTGNLNTANVGLAVGPSFINADGVPQCGTAADPIRLGSGPGNCTPWNPLIPEGVTGYNGLADPAVQAYLYQPGQAVSKTETNDYFANLSGTLFSLPAGDVGMAVGVEHRKESGSFSPDALSQTGISTDLASGPTSGEYSLDEAYLEFLVPVLADLPGAQELSLSLATRYSDYDLFGDTINSKFGFTWKPVDSLLVRGTWAEGFRAPTIADLYGGSSDSFSRYTDSCDSSFGSARDSAACAADVPAGFRQPANNASGVATSTNYQSPIPFRAGSNPELTPENSESKTLGLVWSPGFAQNLNMALDWWNIKIENTIVGDSATQILDDCYLRGIESRCSAENFTRDPATGAISFLTYAPRNAGYQESEGFDFDLTYALDTDWGRFGLNSQTTYVVKNELKTDLSDAPPQQLNGFGGNFRIRSNLGLTWDKGDFGLSWNMRYFSAVKSGYLGGKDHDLYLGEGVRCSLPNFAAPDTQGEITPQNQLGANTFHDVQGRWNTPWNGTIAIGINNVFDHNANADYDRPNSGYSYYGGYDIGRFMYMKYQQRF